MTSDCGFGRQSMSRMHAFYKMVALTRGTNIVRKELGLPEAYIPAADPKLSFRQVASILKRTASGRGVWSPELGFGVIDAAAAVQRAAAAAAR